MLERKDVVINKIYELDDKYLPTLQVIRDEEYRKEYLEDMSNLLEGIGDLFSVDRLYILETERLKLVHLMLAYSTVMHYDEEVEDSIVERNRQMQLAKAQENITTSHKKYIMDTIIFDGDNKVGYFGAMINVLTDIGELKTDDKHVFLAENKDKVD